MYIIALGYALDLDTFVHMEMRVVHQNAFRQRFIFNNIKYRKSSVDIVFEMGNAGGLEVTLTQPNKKKRENQGGKIRGN